MFKKIIVIFAGLFFSSAYAAETLIFSIDLIRHGDRTPIDEIPKSPCLWPQGLGQLTEDGEKQLLQLGKTLRQKYINETHLLPDNYQAATMYVRSTDFTRTIKSAEFFLLGLYPLTNRKNNEKIPIAVVPQRLDDLLYSKPPKKTAAMVDVAQLLKTAPFYSSLDKWSKATGMNLKKDNVFSKLADNLYIRELKHIPLPNGITAADADQMIAWDKNNRVAHFKETQFSYPMGHTFLAAVADYLQKASANKTPLKYILYSANDGGLMSVMTTLGVPLEAVPPYASRINFSLYESDKKYLVKMTYNDQPVTLSDCGGAVCTLEQFNKVTLKNLPVINGIIIQ